MSQVNSGFAWDSSHPFSPDPPTSEGIMFPTPTQDDPMDLSSADVGDTGAAASRVHNTRSRSREDTTIHSDCTERGRPRGPRRRRRYGQLAWDAQKDVLRALYIEEDMSLSAVMAHMKKEYSFDASQKLYKDRFKIWGWQKNLPKEVALFMSARSKRRKVSTGRDTVFKFGGKTWDKARIESTLSRVPRDERAQAEQIDIDTPEGVSCKTPQSSSLDAAIRGDSLSRIETVSSGFNQDGFSDEEGLVFSWRGKSRTDLIAMRATARAYISAGRVSEAEDLLVQVLSGLSCLQGPTNEETVKVMFEVADLHTQADDPSKADKLLELYMRKHNRILGPNHRRTRQFVINIAEVLNGWNRPHDSLGLLSRAGEMVEAEEHRTRFHQLTSGARQQRNKRRRFDIVLDDDDDEIDVDDGEGDEYDEDSAVNDPSSGFSTTFSDSEGPSMEKVDYELSMARPRVLARDESVEDLLLALIKHCEAYSLRLAVQHLRSRAELITLYEKMAVVLDKKATILDTMMATSGILNSYGWNEHKYECLDVLEAAMQVAANLLKIGFDDPAMHIFTRVANKFEFLYQYDSDQSVWALITIGLAYQTHRTWSDASSWFDRALAGALAASSFPAGDGIIRSLEHGINARHFSYVSDEGRPYRTIFGVRGLTITPRRLHLG